jgi:hypothetical protein
MKKNILAEMNPQPASIVWRRYERKHPHSLWHGDLMEKVTLTYEDRTAYQLTLIDNYSRAYVFCDLFREVNVNTTIRALIAAIRSYRTFPKALVFDVPASGEIAYQNFQVPTNFTEDKWVQAIEVRPGGRNAFRGPGLWNLDASLAKMVRINDSHALQFRAEAFNVFNHANLFIQLNRSMMLVRPLPRTDAMLTSRDHSLVVFPIIRVEIALLTINQRNPVLYFASALAAAVAIIEGYDLFAFYVNGKPDPLFVLLATNKTPHLIGFFCKSQEVDLQIEGLRQLIAEIIRQGLILWIVRLKSFYLDNHIPPAMKIIGKCARRPPLFAQR